MVISIIIALAIGFAAGALLRVTRTRIDSHQTSVETLNADDAANTESIDGSENPNRTEQLEQEETSAEETVKTQEEIDEEEIKAIMNTANLTLETLKEIGCEILEEDHNNASATYQGEIFQFVSNKRIISIYDPSWANIENEGNNLEAMRWAVNAVNYEIGPTILMSDPDSNGNVSLHSKLDVVMCGELPDKTDYFRSIFNQFFVKKETFRKTYWGRKGVIAGQQPTDSPAEKRPIGFSAN